MNLGWGKPKQVKKIIGGIRVECVGPSGVSQLLDQQTFETPEAAMQSYLNNPDYQYGEKKFNGNTELLRTSKAIIKTKVDGNFVYTVTVGGFEIIVNNQPQGEAPV